MSEQSRDLVDFLASLRTTAAQSPERLAVMDDVRRVTYKELCDEVATRAARLAEGGVRRGDRVALVAENSTDFLCAAFAVWTVEAALVTVYPSSSKSDLEYCLAASDPVLVLADAATRPSIEASAPEGTPVVSITDPAMAVTVRAGTAPTPSPFADQLALICYTSGTTSRPKAIMQSKQALYNGAEVFGRVWHLGPDDRTAVFLPMAWLFGLASTSMAGLLYQGSVIALRRGRPELVISAIVDAGATYLPGVTTMFVKLVEYLAELPQKPDLSSLRLCVSGGEPRNDAVFDEWTSLSGCAVHDNYCASECFPVITYDPHMDPRPRPGSAGRLVERSEMRVVDEQGNDVGVGEVGEALWRGPGLMLGYWGDPETTRQVLTEDGWYRTRDLVTVDEDGYVSVVGRLSDMIIRGGNNVSPAEVERVLRDHRSVRDACVVGIADVRYGEEVVAAVIPVSAEHPLDGDALTAWCRELLAPYKVPSRFVAVGSLPTNETTGKVDRKAVRELVGSGDQRR